MFTRRSSRRAPLLRRLRYTGGLRHNRSHHQLDPSLSSYFSEACVCKCFLSSWLHSCLFHCWLSACARSCHGGLQCCRLNKDRSLMPNMDDATRPCLLNKWRSLEEARVSALSRRSRARARRAASCAAARAASPARPARARVSIAREGISSSGTCARAVRVLGSWAAAAPGDGA